LSTLAPHDFIECFEIGACLPVGEVLGRLQSRNLLRHSCGHELIDAGSILPAQAFHGLFERTRHP
jgi:hypothetical protein